MVRVLATAKEGSLAWVAENEEQKQSLRDFLTKVLSYISKPLPNTT